MADEKDLTQAPEDCTHSCGTCHAECDHHNTDPELIDEVNGKIWDGIEKFSTIESDDLLGLLNQIASEE